MWLYSTADLFRQPKSNTVSVLKYLMSDSISEGKIVSEKMCSKSCTESGWIFFTTSTSVILGQSMVMKVMMMKIT